MNNIKKRKQVRIYLDEVRERKFMDIVNRIDTVSESVIMTAMVSAAIDACGNELTLPLKFKVVKETPQPHTFLTDSSGSMMSPMPHNPENERLSVLTTDVWLQDERLQDESRKKPQKPQ